MHDKIVSWHGWIRRAVSISTRVDDIGLGTMFKIIVCCLNAESNFLYLVRDFQSSFELEMENSVVSKGSS